MCHPERKRDPTTLLFAPPASSACEPAASGVANSREDDAPAPVRCDPLEVLSINEPELGRNECSRAAYGLQWIENEAAPFKAGSPNEDGGIGLVGVRAQYIPRARRRVVPENAVASARLTDKRFRPGKFR